MLLGMGLIIASQAVQAAQITFEDFFMVGAGRAGRGGAGRGRAGGVCHQSIECITYLQVAEVWECAAYTVRASVALWRAQRRGMAAHVGDKLGKGCSWSEAIALCPLWMVLGLQTASPT